MVLLDLTGMWFKICLYLISSGHFGHLLSLKTRRLRQGAWHKTVFLGFAEKRFGNWLAHLHKFNLGLHNYTTYANAYAKLEQNLKNLWKFGALTPSSNSPVPHLSVPGCIYWRVVETVGNLASHLPILAGSEFSPAIQITTVCPR